MANRPARLEGFSYIGEYRYFLTFCVENRSRVFEIDLNARCVLDQILRVSCALGFEAIAYCAMPDHLHVLVVGLRQDSDLCLFVKTYKQVTGYWWKHQGHMTQLWQEGFHDRVLREHDSTEAVVRYILLNPVRARLVSDPRDYPYIGATKYDVPTLLESAFVWDPPWKCKSRRT